MDENRVVSLRQKDAIDDTPRTASLLSEGKTPDPPSGGACRLAPEGMRLPFRPNRRTDGHSVIGQAARGASPSPRRRPHRRLFRRSTRSVIRGTFPGSRLISSVYGSKILTMSEAYGSGAGAARRKRRDRSLGPASSRILLKQNSRGGCVARRRYSGIQYRVIDDSLAAGPQSTIIRRVARRSVCGSR